MGCCGSKEDPQLNLNFNVNLASIHRNQRLEETIDKAKKNTTNLPFNTTVKEDIDHPYQPVSVLKETASFGPFSRNKSLSYNRYEDDFNGLKEDIGSSSNVNVIYHKKSIFGHLGKHDSQNFNKIGNMGILEYSNSINKVTSPHSPNTPLTQLSHTNTIINPLQNIKSKNFNPSENLNQIIGIDNNSIEFQTLTNTNLVYQQILNTNSNQQFEEGPSQISQVNKFKEMKMKGIGSLSQDFYTKIQPKEFSQKNKYDVMNKKAMEKLQRKIDSNDRNDKSEKNEISSFIGNNSILNESRNLNSVFHSVNNFNNKSLVVGGSLHNTRDIISQGNDGFIKNEIGNFQKEVILKNNASNQNIFGGRARRQILGMNEGSIGGEIATDRRFNNKNDFLNNESRFANINQSHFNNQSNLSNYNILANPEQAEHIQTAGSFVSNYGTTKKINNLSKYKHIFTDSSANVPKNKPSITDTANLQNNVNFTNSNIVNTSLLGSK